MQDINLSIIIVNFNSGNYLARTAESIVKSPSDSTWEAIVIDNLSTDDSFTTVKSEYSDDHRFTFIDAGENLGFAGGNNKAIEQAKGKFLLLLNPDTSVTDGALDMMINYLSINKDTGAVGAKLIGEDNTSTVSFGWFPTSRGIISGAFLPKRLQGPKSGGLGIAPGDSLKQPLEVDYVSGACLMTSREIWDKNGPLDTGYFAYFEETDWCLRLKKIGYKTVLLPDVKVYHYEGKSFSGIPFKKMEIFVTSAKRFFKLHFPPGLCRAYVNTNILASTLKIFYLSLTGWFSQGRRERVKPVIAHHRAFLKALLKK